MQEGRPGPAGAASRLRDGAGTRERVRGGGRGRRIRSVARDTCPCRVASPPESPFPMTGPLGLRGVVCKTSGGRPGPRGTGTKHPFFPLLRSRPSFGGVNPEPAPEGAFSPGPLDGDREAGGAGRRSPFQRLERGGAAAAARPGKSVPTAVRGASSHESLRSKRGREEPAGDSVGTVGAGRHRGSARAWAPQGSRRPDARA